jgi:hypothetical protein
LKDSLCRLCVLWKKSVRSLDIAVADDELDPWGPNADELLNANIVEVTAAWGDDEEEEEEEEDGIVDGEEDMDIGLINALEAVDLADAYRSNGADEDNIDFINDI